MSEARGTRYPAEWQRKAIWAAVSALAVSFLIFVLVAAIWIMANVISFLQPILIPVAIAAILAYLLDPVVTRMADRKSTRLNSSHSQISYAVFCLKKKKKRHKKSCILVLKPSTPSSKNILPVHQIVPKLFRAHVANVYPARDDHTQGPRFSCSYT